MHDSKQGWVRVYRKSIDSSVWSSPNIWFVWSWCLMKANHTSHFFPFNGVDVEIKPGSFITGINKAIAELPTFTPQRYRSALTYLKSTGRITVQSNNKYSVITIVKWENYQLDNRQDNKPITNQQQTNNKPITTYKNDKKEKNDKEVREIESVAPQPPTPKSKMIEFLESVKENSERLEKFIKLIAENKGISASEVKKEVMKFASYWSELNSTGKKMRWELEKTFEFDRRLNHWLNNVNKWSTVEKTQMKFIDLK